MTDLTTDQRWANSTAAEEGARTRDFFSKLDLVLEELRITRRDLERQCTRLAGFTPEPPSDPEKGCEVKPAKPTCIEAMHDAINRLNYENGPLRTAVDALCEF